MATPLSYGTKRELAKLSFIGAGVVGLTSAVVMTVKTRLEIVVYDISEEHIENLKMAQCPFYEPGLDIMLAQTLKHGHHSPAGCDPKTLSSNRRLTFTTDLESATHNSDMIFLCLPTPSLSNSSPTEHDGPTQGSLLNISETLKVAAKIATLAKKDLIIVNRSTSPIGSLREIERVVKKLPTSLLVEANCLAQRI